jgi:hypothetical protein
MMGSLNHLTMSVLPLEVPHRTRTIRQREGVVLTRQEIAHGCGGSRAPRGPPERSAQKSVRPERRNNESMTVRSAWSRSARSASSVARLAPRPPG